MSAAAAWIYSGSVGGSVGRLSTLHQAASTPPRMRQVGDEILQLAVLIQ